MERDRKRVPQAAVVAGETSERVVINLENLHHFYDETGTSLIVEIPTRPINYIGWGEFFQQFEEEVSQTELERVSEDMLRILKKTLLLKFFENRIEVK